jgi:hypothetical protein
MHLSTYGFQCLSVPYWTGNASTNRINPWGAHHELYHILIACHKRG